MVTRLQKDIPLTVSTQWDLADIPSESGAHLLLGVTGFTAWYPSVLSPFQFFAFFLSFCFFFPSLEGPGRSLSMRAVATLFASTSHGQQYPIGHWAGIPTRRVGTFRSPGYQSLVSVILAGLRGSAEGWSLSGAWR
ncbi:hypothetical protein AVEN_61589-1 [Araneus ventricosus]|uniref:Uncharacterized protein n=1 Tax=Araneus ventricosus TaxID=182803 RepID=A0A4Y2NM38_ARAVE|nr:hypothetical protein AVEN_61589-1 [Araneus ventricosus]